MSLKVHFVKEHHVNLLDDLRALLRDDVVMTTDAASADDAMHPDDYDILVGGFLGRELLERSPHLRAVIVPFAGVPIETRELVAAYPNVTLHNLHYNVPPTAETTLALLLAAAKFVVPIDRELRAGDWRSRYAETPVTLLSGKTALILGFGHIGQYLAPILRAMGMTVLGVRRDPPAPGEDDPYAIYPPGALAGLLPHADVLIDILPLTPETDGLIGAHELDLLPHDAIVVNVGRGPTVDEEALYSALVNKRLLAAGIDVWYTYPRTEDERVDTLPSSFPFHELDNVVMSPHRAGFLSAAEPERMVHLARLLNAAAAGEPIPNQVNKQLGY